MYVCNVLYVYVCVGGCRFRDSGVCCCRSGMGLGGESELALCCLDQRRRSKREMTRWRAWRGEAQPA